MQIYIPTYGRSDHQVTWDNLPHAIKFNTKLVVQNREREKYEKYPHIVLPWGLTGIGRTRQWLIENTTAKHIVMIDDDLDFAVRRDDALARFRGATDVDIHGMLEEMEWQLRHEFKLVGVSGREGANRNTEQFLTVTRQMRIHGLDAEFFKQANIRFDRLEFMEDFDATLQLLELGYPNCVLNHWVHNQRSGSNAPGGCSEERTLEKHNQAALALKKLHPKFVKVVEKDTGNWGGLRLDVYIQWKKAYHDRIKYSISG